MSNFSRYNLLHPTVCVEETARHAPKGPAAPLLSQCLATIPAGWMSKSGYQSIKA